MSWFTARRLLVAGLKEALVYYGANVGERLARKHFPMARKKAAKPTSKPRKRRHDR